MDPMSENNPKPLVEDPNQDAMKRLASAYPEIAKVLWVLMDPVAEEVFRENMGRMGPEELARVGVIADSVDLTARILATAGSYEGLRDMAMGAGRFNRHSALADACCGELA